MVEQDMASGELFVHADRAAYVKDSLMTVPLTKREMEVLRVLSDGLSNQEIANRFGLTEATVKSHLSHLYKKLGSIRRTQAIALARVSKLLD